MKENTNKNIITNIHNSKETYKNKADIIYEITLKLFGHQYVSKSVDSAIEIYNELCEKGIIIEKDNSTNEKVNLNKTNIDDEDYSCKNCGYHDFEVSTTYSDTTGVLTSMIYSFECKQCGHKVKFSVPMIRYL